MDVLIGVLVAIPTVLFTIKFKALKISAAVLAGILITIISYCGGISAVLILIGAYFSVILLEKILKKSSRLTEDINKKQGARDFIQVFVNGISAVLFIILFKITANHIFFLTYIVGIIEALADSVASDVGILSKKPPTRKGRRFWQLLLFSLLLNNNYLLSSHLPAYSNIHKISLQHSYLYQPYDS